MRSLNWGLAFGLLNSITSFAADSTVVTVRINTGVCAAPSGGPNPGGNGGTGSGNSSGGSNGGDESSIESPNGTYNFDGVYNAPASGNLLDGQSYTGKDVDVANCALYCGGTAYFALSQGDQCSCGNVLLSTTKSADYQRSASESSLPTCDYQCSGDTSECCGYGTSYIVYSRSLTPSGSGSQSGVPSPSASGTSFPSGSSPSPAPGSGGYNGGDNGVDNGGYNGGDNGGTYPGGGGTTPGTGDDTTTPGTGDGTTTPGTGDGTTPGTGDGTTNPGTGDGTYPGTGDGTTPGTGDGTTPGTGDGTTPGTGNGTTPGTGDGTAAPGTGDGTITPGTGDGTITPGTGDGTITPGTGDGTTTPGTGDGTTPGTGDGTTPGTGDGTTTPGTGDGTTPGTGGGTTPAAPAEDTITTDPQCPTNNHTLYTDSYGTTYEVRCGIDLIGAEFNVIHADSFVKCLQYCSILGGCAGVTYTDTQDPNLGTCHAHSTFIGYGDPVTEPSYSGVPTDGPTAILYGIDDCSQTTVTDTAGNAYTAGCDGRNAQGGDLYAYQGRSLRACIEYCHLLGRCIGVDFVGFNPTDFRQTSCYPKLSFTGYADQLGTSWAVLSTDLTT